LAIVRQSLNDEVKGEFRMSIVRHNLVFLTFFIFTMVSVTGNVRADFRTEYLVTMLEKGGNYRVRVQAATTLGRLRATDAVHALTSALEDESDLVVISAATALGQIGDVSVIPAVEKALSITTSSAAKSQIEVTLRVLRALSPEGDTTAAENATPRYLIRVDVMGNSSGTGDKDIVDFFRDIVVKRLKTEPGVVLQKPGMTNKNIKTHLKKEKLDGYIISGSLIRLEHVDGQVVVKLSLNVFSNPDYNLLMMPTAEGAVPVRSGPIGRERERSAQERGIKTVVNSLVGTIVEKMQTMDNP
jgi:HEAT repeats